MLNHIIRYALQHRVLVLALALLLLALGGWQATQLPIDVFPDLNRPRVTVMTECPGLAPEEVEALVTAPIETALHGALGVQAVRSNSAVGLSIVHAEFGWGSDILLDRQIVNEKLALVSERLPPGVRPQVAPVSSVMGQIMIVGLWSEGGQTDALELRTLADWVIVPRLMTIRGVSQVFAIGGGRKQFQVLVNPRELNLLGVTLADVEAALEQANVSATGGYIVGRGSTELLVRALGRVETVADLQKLVVKANRQGPPILLRQVARVQEGPQVKRGDAAAYLRDAQTGRSSGGPAVVLTIEKQPGADTRHLTASVAEALADLRSSLPPDVRIAEQLYQQRRFIDLAVHNVATALWHGGVLVAVVLLLFLMNLRTTVITLTAIPLSLMVTVLVFRWFGMSINTMTLGGLAVAIGELVDDAIVDVENVFRRLGENRRLAQPRPALRVVFEASAEIRNSIVYSTLIVVLVFVPLFALSGMEGRLFRPLAVAYIVSILSSLAVSLTVTPVLAYYLLPQGSRGSQRGDGLLLRGLKAAAGGVIRFSLRWPRTLVAGAVLAVALSVVFLLRLQNDFMPPFDEGVVQLNVVLPPGTSLARSLEVARSVESRLLQIDGVETLVTRTGRAELDEHAIGVNMSEIIANIRPGEGRTREQILGEIRCAMADIPGIVTSVEQPLAHLISAMLSGVQAQVAVKLYGENLDLLRSQIEEVKAIVSRVPGATDVMVEPQVIIPQVRIEPDRDQLAAHGLTPGDVTRLVETALHGRTISEVQVGQRRFDLALRFDQEFREDIEGLTRLPLEVPGGGSVPLGTIARVYRAGGPNVLNHEHVRRRVVLQCNVAGRGLVDVVRDIQQRLEPFRKKLPTGYWLEYAGQFESQQRAVWTIGGLLLVSWAAIFLTLFTMFRSVNFALQIMAALPAAFIGAVAAVYLTGQTLSIASMVGFISLCGIATRNGILLLDHYRHLVQCEGESWTPAMIVRAGQERLAPVLMTALTAGIGLVPLALAAGQPGKEILYPVATVIIGGLISSTVLEFLVRPALFWLVGRGAGERILEHAQRERSWFDAEGAPPSSPAPPTAVPVA